MLRASAFGIVPRAYQSIDNDERLHIWPHMHTLDARSCKVHDLYSLALYIGWQTVAGEIVLCKCLLLSWRWNKYRTFLLSSPPVMTRVSVLLPNLSCNLDLLASRSSVLPGHVSYAWLQNCGDGVLTKARLPHTPSNVTAKNSLGLQWTQATVKVQAKRGMAIIMHALFSECVRSI